jgi:hypothetical protein
MELSAHSSGVHIIAVEQIILATLMAKSKLPKDMSLMAQLSADSYLPLRRRKGVQGWTYVPEQSTTYHAIYYQDDGNRAVVANRGTKPTHVADLQQDLNIILGQGDKSSRVKTAVRIGKRVERQTGREVTYTGHSMGSTQAYFAGRLHKRPSYNFNMGSSPAQLLKEAGRMVKCEAGFEGECIDDETTKNTHIFHNSADPLSVASYKFQAQHHETPSKWTNWDAHGLDQFIS